MKAKRLKSPWVEILLFIAAAPFVAILLFFGIIILGFGCPAVPASKMDKMQEGINQEEVRNILGSPSSIHTNNNGAIFWGYTRKLSFRHLTVRFENDSVTSYEEDDD